MRVTVLTIVSSKEDWLEQAQELYIKKLSPFIEFSLIELKSKKLGRDDANFKKESESKQILDYLKPTDYVILCDERGKELDSIQFSKSLFQLQDQGQRSLVFIIGGAFGVSEQLKKRAQLKLKLSSMVFNHLVAQVVLLEQIYRAAMIHKGRPYHNE